MIKFDIVNFKGDDILNDIPVGKCGYVFYTENIEKFIRVIVERSNRNYLISFHLTGVKYDANAIRYTKKDDMALNGSKYFRFRVLIFKINLDVDIEKGRKNFPLVVDIKNKHIIVDGNTYPIEGIDMVYNMDHRHFFNKLKEYNMIQFVGDIY